MKNTTIIPYAIWGFLTVLTSCMTDQERYEIQKNAVDFAIENNLLEMVSCNHSNMSGSASYCFSSTSTGCVNKKKDDNERP